MPRIDYLWLTTDFDSLKTDGFAEASFVIPGGDILTAGETKNYTADAEVGTPNSLLLADYSNSIDFPDGSYAALTSAFNYTRTGSLGPYSVIVLATHTGDSTVRFLCTIRNPYGSSLTLAAANETWRFRAHTIKLPRFT